MGVLQRFTLVVGVPAEGLTDTSGASLLERAKVLAAEEYEDEGDQAICAHLDNLLPESLRAYEGGSWSYGGERRFIVGKALLTLEEVKGLLGWDVAGPLMPEQLETTRREVAEALGGIGGATEPRVIMLGHTY